MLLTSIISAALAAALSGFGVSPNANAPSGADLMRYAPDNVDALVHVDFQAFVPKNYAALQALADDSALSSLPHFQKKLKQALVATQFALGSAQAVLGIDVIRDIHSASAFLVVPSRKQPVFVAVVRGAFPANIVDKLASLLPDQERVTAAGLPALSREGLLIARARDGVMLFGTASLVRARLAQGWRPLTPKPGTALGRVANIMDTAKPFLLVASTLSARAVQRIKRALAVGQFATSLLNGHRFAAVFLTHRGAGWNVTMRTRGGLEVAVMGSRGLVELLRAAQFGGRGSAHLLLAGAESLKGQHSELDALLKHKSELVALVNDLGGDGSFTDTSVVDQRTRTLTVRAEGKQLSHVLPAVALIPVTAALLYTSLKKTPAPAP